MTKNRLENYPLVCSKIDKAEKKFLCPECNCFCYLNKGPFKREFWDLGDDIKTTRRKIEVPMRQFGCSGCQRLYTPSTKEIGPKGGWFTWQVINKALSNLAVGRNLQQTHEELASKHYVQVSLSTINLWKRKYSKIYRKGERWWLKI